MIVGVAFAYFYLLLPAVGVVSHIRPRDIDAGAVGAPSLYQSPRLRWWWPGGWIEPDEVQSEITAIIDAGFGGAEIGDVEDSIEVEIDPQVYGWAQGRWNTAQANETGLDLPNTVKENRDPITLTDLVAWPNITGLVNASGIGTYETTVSLTKGNSSAVRVLLDVGEVKGTWSVRLNGQVLTAVHWFGNKPIDVTDLVHDGVNHLEVTVATTLWNKLRAVWPELYGWFEAQLIGLFGPMTFFSYSLETGLWS